MITVKTAEAVKDYVAELCPIAEVRRSYLPVADLETLEKLNKPVVFVIPVDREAEIVTQGGSRKNTLTIDIAVNKKLHHIGADEYFLTEEIDELVDMSEAIYNEFMKKVKIVCDKFRITLDQPEHIFISDYESIMERNCFLGVIRITADVYEIIINNE